MSDETQFIKVPLKEFESIKSALDHAQAELQKRVEDDLKKNFDMKQLTDLKPKRVILEF